MRNAKLGQFEKYVYLVILNFIFQFLFYNLYSPLPSMAANIDEEITMSSSPNPVGSGARALGMGGAFIAIADDATAAAWNPAGIIQLELPEVSVVGAWSHRANNFTYDAFAETTGLQTSDTGELNYLSAVKPFNFWGYNMVASINYQHLYDFSQNNRFSYTKRNKYGNLTLNQDVDVAITMDGSLRTMSPALAVQISPQLTVGVTLNFWKDPLDGNKWRVRYVRNETGSFNRNDYIITSDTLDEYDFSGGNFHLGLLWNINPVFTLGLVFKSPFTADLTRNVNAQRTLSYPAIPEYDSFTSTSQSEKQEMNMPMSYGIGLAARLNDSFSLSLDLYRTHWDDYSIKTADGSKVSPITGGNFDAADVDPTTQVRFGAEYLFISPKYVIPLRGGIFYDPEPAPDRKDDFFGFTMGSGISWKKIILDISYQYRFGNRAYSRLIGNQTSYRDVDQHTVYTSLIYHF